MRDFFLHFSPKSYFFCYIIYVERANNQKPEIRELTLKKGLSFPSDEELIMMILGSGIKGNSVENLSEKVSRVLLKTETENLIPALLKIKGIGTGKALQIAASVELGRRFTCHKNAKIHTATDLIPYVQHYTLFDREHFLTVTLNGANEIINIHVASIGTVNQTVVHPREIFSHALEDNASAIILCHNHPSGNTQPSEPDIHTTRRLLKASDILGIPVLDHIIISRENHFSFFENKMLKLNEEALPLMEEP